MKNMYQNSWEVYKAHSESFNDDYDYYYQFCKGYKTLELFAGYGRLSNFLMKEGVDIETVEIEPRFSSFIQLNPRKKHVCDVLEFNTLSKFDRIIAGYNSFCLLTNENDIFLFFKKIESLLIKGGMASLSYYPISSWKKSEEIIDLKNGNKMIYKSTFDFSFLNNDIAIWIDEYLIEHTQNKFEYSTKVYKNDNELEKYLKHTKLRLKEIIYNYNNSEIKDPGWVEYVLINDR